MQGPYKPFGFCHQSCWNRRQPNTAQPQPNQRPKFPPKAKQPVMPCAPSEQRTSKNMKPVKRASSQPSPQKQKIPSKQAQKLSVKSSSAASGQHLKSNNMAQRHKNIRIVSQNPSVKPSRQGRSSH